MEHLAATTGTHVVAIMSNYEQAFASRPKNALEKVDTGLRHLRQSGDSDIG